MLHAIFGCKRGEVYSASRRSRWSRQMLRRRYYIALVALFQVISGTSRAQNIRRAPRITEALDDTRLVSLPGNTHPMAQAEFDRGPAPPGLQLNRMQLVLTRSDEQTAALHKLLDSQQDSSAPQFHKWLTPEQFGDQFGAADQDIEIVSKWLESQGFAIGHVSRGKALIEFSGTADLVRNAFHTEIRKFVVNGEEHWANAGDPQIPRALAPVVGGIATLHNFKAKPLYRVSDKAA